MSAYNSPQIQRKELIPLAEKFVKNADDISSLGDFMQFVSDSSTPNLKKSNNKTWRKDALKALRLVNARSLLDAGSGAKDNSQIVIEEDCNNKEDESFIGLTPKRRKTAPNMSNVEVVDLPVPTLKLADFKNTLPHEVLQKSKLFVKCCLNKQISFGVWPSLLVNGPPFCGKSLLVEALAGSFKAHYLRVSVGVLAANMRTWKDLFNRAKDSAPCILHLDDIESMEKHSIPTGSFRLTCLLKSELLKELVGTGVVVVGETRSLFASLPQSVLDLFTQRVTFGMMEEAARLNFLNKHLVETENPSDARLLLVDQLSVAEIAKRTPGYEAGDLLRLVAQLRITLLSAADSDSEEEGMETDDAKSLQVNRETLEACLANVTPAAKNTAEFVTVPDVTWNDIGGLASTKTELHNRFMLLVDDWERAQLLGRRSNGVLLEGPPGCGKTLIAKALSNCAGLNFLSVKGPEILNKYQGESERRIREIFERARACQPCLIFFDEIDAICPVRDGDEATGSRVSVVNQLLVELDGVDKHRSTRLFVVGATNRKDMIDPAILRPGRLGLHLLVKPPQTTDDRLAVLSACTKGGTRPEFENGLASLVAIANDPRTVGMSGADLENLLDVAKQNAHIAKNNFVSDKDLVSALYDIVKSC